MLLKTRIIIGISLAMVLLAVGFWLTFQFSEQRIRQQSFLEKTSSKRAFLEYILQGQKQQMSSQMRSLTRNRGVLSALNMGVIENIKEQVNPTFKRLKTSGIVDALSISNPNGTFLFHAPAKINRSSVKTLVNRAIKKGKIVYGMAKGENGQLSVVLAYPLYHQRKLIAGVAYTRSFQSIAAEYKANDGAEVFVTSHGKFVLSTNAKIFQGIDISMLKKAGMEGEQIAIGKSYFDVLALPINNIDGQHIAQVFTLTDVTSSYLEQRRFSWLTQGGLAGLILIFLAGMAFWLSRQFKPMSKIIDNLEELAKGNLNVSVDDKDSKDEIGAIIKTVRVFRENLVEMDDMRRSQKAAEISAKEEKHAMMTKMADDFDRNIGGIVETVSSATTQLQATARSMTGISEQTRDQANAASSASEQTSSNVQSVATAAEEMTSTIGEISQQVAQATQASSLAVEEVGNTSQQMGALADTANKIGEVVEIISGIAEQTNLLALNATIESARAGEAGKGFAVVANEVKELASQTAKATGEISQQISDIQNATKQASGSMDSVAQAIGRFDEMSTAIAATMEEQGAATQEIASSVNQAALGTQQVNDNIMSVSQATQEAGAASSQVTTAAGELSQQAAMLKGEVDKFVTQIRTG